MRPGRKTDKQLVSAIGRRLELVRFGVPTVELSGDGDLLNVGIGRAVGEGVAVGRLHADKQNALEGGRVIVFFGRDGCVSFLASNLAHIGLAAFDNADGDLEQTRGLRINLHTEGE